MPTSFIEVIVLSRDVVETRRYNAKLVDRNRDLVQKLKDVKTVERPACKI